MALHLMPKTRHGSTCFKGLRVHNPPFLPAVLGSNKTIYAQTKLVLNIFSKRFAPNASEFWMKGNLSPVAHWIKFRRNYFPVSRYLFILWRPVACCVPLALGSLEPWNCGLWGYFTDHLEWFGILVFTEVSSKIVLLFSFLNYTE